MKLMVICAWCRQFIRFKDSLGDIPPKNPISHGICDECKRTLENQIRPTVNLSIALFDHR
jgi:hypothetical protein